MSKYGPKPTPPSERFWKHVSPGAPDDCWEWRGARHSQGYGYLRGGPLYSATWAKAHRLSWEIHNGPIPAGMSVLHHCDNPPCCNPAHLYIGRDIENARDRADRKRGKEHRQRGEDNDNAKLTEAQVRGIITELQKLPRRSQSAIAAEFGVKQPQVSRIMLRKSWTHLWDE